MRFFHKKRSIVLTLVLAVEFFAANVLSVSAIHIPSTSEVLSQMENRYHLNTGSIQNQGETFNVAGGKAPTPEVSVFFSPSDPRAGEKLSAKAFPMYFSNEEGAMYYTWYLKRKDCDADKCDYNNDGRYDQKDWKIEAMRILAQNGYDNASADYGSDSDNDGYRAKFGGDNKTDMPNYCYVHDNSSGTNYELVGSSSDSSFGCQSGYSPVCAVEQEQVNADSGFTGTGSVFNSSSTGLCNVSGYPTCSSIGFGNLSGTPSCNTGDPVCVSDESLSTSTFSCGTGITPAITSCSSQIVSKNDNPSSCDHLFPNAPGETTGDGSFGKNEERFWGTNPNDPDTAENGNKDEANVAGLGQSTFTWNYAPGDEMGVVVEGTSMFPTKHDNSSNMIMWAFPKKNCPPKNTGSYTTTIKGYAVVIPTVDMDLNSCIEKNLINPAQGGQATNLEVSVSATPDNPVNDETSDKGGDAVDVQASISNAQHSLTDMSFEWTVEISKDISFNTRRDITSQLRNAGLLGNIKGNALDSIRVKLDMPSSVTSGYLNGGIGYLRFKTTVTENFSGDTIRKGKSDVIVKFTSTSKKISAYKAGTELSSVSGTQMMKVTTDTDNGAVSICNADVLDRAACRVVKNEIIGLKVDSAGLSNFNWTLNGQPLTCSHDKVSADCTDGEQNNVNFFPVIGNKGDTYTVAVTANDVETGNVVTLTRTFGVVDPEVAIEPLDRNTVWPRLLGQYRDITGSVAACPDGLCNDYSTSMFEAFPGSAIGFRAVFIPGFLGSVAEKEWSVDGATIAESAPGEISFPADKLPGGVYNIVLTAQAKQSDEIRRALLDIWGISPFDSPEINFTVSNQVQLQDPGIANSPESGPRKYLAAIASYIPASVLFTFRIFLSAILMLFTASFLYALLSDRRAKAIESSFPEGE